MSYTLQPDAVASPRPRFHLAHYPTRFMLSSPVPPPSRDLLHVAFGCASAASPLGTPSSCWHPCLRATVVIIRMPMIPPLVVIETLPQYLFFCPSREVYMVSIFGLKSFQCAADNGGPSFDIDTSESIHIRSTLNSPFARYSSKQSRTPRMPLSTSSTRSAPRFLLLVT